MTASAAEHAAPSTTGRDRTRTGIAVVGCGYVFDHYLATWERHPQLELTGVFDLDRQRVEAVTRTYGLRGYGSLEEVLTDPDVDIVVNLTSIDAHAEVTRAALEAGKHVFTEKPVAAHLEQAQELYEVADAHGVLLAAAPSNILSPTIQTLWKAVHDGAVGTPRLVYAEFDDNPIHLMHPEQWRSRTGAPWPYRDEYEHGCTIEHAGYHLYWLCALFGPVASVTAFSKQIVEDKAPDLDPPDTPDLSISILHFASGVVARLTFSIAAPLDHSMQVVGDKGVLRVETYRDYTCPVYLERFADVTLNARKARSVRTRSWLSAVFGVGGGRIPLVPAPHGRARGDVPHASGRPTPRRLLRALVRRETGVQDKCMGIAELADAVVSGRQPFPPADLTLHVTELMYAIHEAGTDATTHRMRTSFAPVTPSPSTLAADTPYRPPLRTVLLDALLRRRLGSMHRH